MAENNFIEVAKVNEIPSGQMKHAEVNGKEVLIANVSGKFYAMSDRRGHMNALLSMGNLTGNTVTCPFHGSKFDVITGKKLTEPNLAPPQGMEPLPTTWQKFFESVGQLMAHIKTYDQIKYETRVDGDRVKIKL
jgi:nitrite reductase/ring-hydroxylating ferredoxin subunit